MITHADSVVSGEALLCDVCVARGGAAGIINRLAPPDKHLEVARELALQVAKNPPLAVRTTVRTRRWYMERLTREAQFIAAPFKLYLTEDFQEAARAFAEKRPPGPFKGR